MKTIMGIKEEKIERLKKNKLQTFELITTDNVETSEKIKEGEDIFITAEGKMDIKRDTEGVLAEANKIERFYNKVGDLFDEEEALTVRIQVEYIEEVKTEDVILEDKGVEVEVEEHLWTD